jgi:hypothetical protein
MQDGRPISFLSKSLGPRAAGFSTYDKEAWALIEAIKKWKHYISEATLILHTDQQSLKYIGDQKSLQGIQHKLLIKLLGYNYRIEYKKGKQNRAADALSRRPQCNTMAISIALPLWVNEVLESYKGDPKCLELEEQLRITPSALPNFAMVNGLIRHKGKILVGNSTDIGKRLLESFHNSNLGGHFGEMVTHNKLQSLFY